MKKLLFLTVSCIVFVHQTAHAMSLRDAAMVGDVEQVTALLNTKGTDVNQRGYRDETPLQVAVYSNNEAVVLLLLKHNANANQPDNGGSTPLHEAARKGNEAIARLLLKHGANVDKSDNGGRTPLHEAACYGHDAVARLLLEHTTANVNQPDNDGWAPLHLAALNGCEAVVRLLLKHRADVNLQNKNGLTPLRTAAFSHHEAVVRLLQAWPIMQQQACVAAQLAFCVTQHPRLGARSHARDLPQYSIREILQYVRPSDFLVIPAKVAPVVPAHATPTPTLSQQAWATAQNILSDPRIQIAAAAVTVLSFVAWRLLHH